MIKLNKTDKDMEALLDKEIRLAIFDMDGVIFRGPNFWLELHQRYGTSAQGVELADQYLHENYAKLAKEVAGKLWKGKPAAPYLSLIENREYVYGIKRLTRRLRRAGIPMAILSSGPWHLAQRAVKDLGFELVLANRLHIEQGKLTGGIDIGVEDGKKLEMGKRIVAHFGCRPSQTIYVGDSANDVQFANYVRFGIAFNSRCSQLDKAAKHHLSGNINQLARVVAMG